MPFTLFHLGPALFFGILFLGVLNFPAFILGNVIVDIEPAIIMFSGLDIPLHGFFHSLIGGAIAAILLSIVIIVFKKQIKEFMRNFGIEQKFTKPRIFAGAIAGIWLHIFMDSLVYPYPVINPIFPLQGNPFYVGMDLITMYLVCIAFFLAGIGLYAYKFQIKKKK